MRRSLLLVDFNFDLYNKKKISGLGKSSFANFFTRRYSSDPSKALDSLEKKVGKQENKLKFNEYWAG